MDHRSRFSSAFFAFLLVFALVFSVVSTSEAAQKAEYKWKLGIPWSRPAVDENLKLFCQLINEYSGGRIEVKYYPDGQLGTHDETFHAVRKGDVAMGLFAPYVNLVPGGMVNWMP